MATETRFTVTIYLPVANTEAALTELHRLLSLIAAPGGSYEVDEVEQYDTEG